MTVHYIATKNCSFCGEARLPNRFKADSSICDECGDFEMDEEATDLREIEAALD